MSSALQGLLVAPRPEFLATYEERLLASASIALERRLAGDERAAAEAMRRGFSGCGAR
jgi:hypothetical protein